MQACVSASWNGTDAWHHSSSIWWFMFSFSAHVLAVPGLCMVRSVQFFATDTNLWHAIRWMGAPFCTFQKMCYREKRTRYQWKGRRNGVSIEKRGRMSLCTQMGFVPALQYSNMKIYATMLSQCHLMSSKTQAQCLYKTKFVQLFHSECFYPSSLSPPCLDNSLWFPIKFNLICTRL